MKLGKNSLRIANAEDYLRSGHLTTALSYFLTREELELPMREAEKIALDRFKRLSRTEKRRLRKAIRL